MGLDPEDTAPQPRVRGARDLEVRDRRLISVRGEVVKLTDKEQRHVRTALRFLRYRVGGW